MSEHPRDDEELQSFLEGDSVLSRRYRDASNEQPPAKVDAAILAASQWAVGAEPGQGGQRSTAARSGRAARGASGWWDKLFSRWSVPLATAAVVAIAATLTLMIERDPELDRIEREYDPVASNAPDKRSVDTEMEQPMKEQGVLADANEALVSSAPKASVSEPAKPEQVNSAQAKPERAKPAPSSPPERLAFRPVEQDATVTAKDITAAAEAAGKEVAKTEATVSVAARPAMPAEQAVAQFADDAVQPAMTPEAGSGRPTEEESMAADMAATAEPRRDAEALRAEGVSAIGVASEPASAPVAAEATEPADESSALSPAAIAEQDSATAPPGVGSARTRTPASSDTLAAARDPEQWIADIEEQLALGNRELARAAVRNFRERYPDYKLPDALKELLPANDQETGEPGIGNQ